MSSVFHCLCCVSYSHTDRPKRRTFHSHGNYFKSVASCALLCGQYWVYLGVKTCEVFLCFLAIIFLGSIVWSSLVHLLCFRHFVLPPVRDNDRRKIKLKFIFLLVCLELHCLAVTISTRMKTEICIWTQKIVIHHFLTLKNLQMLSRNCQRYPMLFAELLLITIIFDNNRCNN